jgi:AraC-like DNA-binding protein
MSVLISNEHLPAGERFDCWRETLRQARLFPVEVRADNEADYRFTMRYADLGAARVSLFTAMPFRMRRTPRLIRESSPDLLSLGMVLSGHVAFTLPGRQADVRPGTFCVYETCRPYRIDAGAPGASAGRGLMMTFPRTLLPVPAGKLRQVTGVTMPAGPGIGTLASRLLVQLATGMGHYTRAEAARLSTAAMEVLAVRLAHALDSDRSVPPETHRGALLTSIHAFIQQHTGDAELSPEMIAAAHHISLRLLHKLFNEQGETVADWIRTRRLEGSRRSLADPAQAARPVAALAAHWGFRSAASFSRTFRAAYGLPPHQYRLTCNPGHTDSGRLATVGELD